MVSPNGLTDADAAIDDNHDDDNDSGMGMFELLLSLPVANVV